MVPERWSAETGIEELMEMVWTLLGDNHTVGGRVATTVVVVLVGLALAWLLGHVVGRRSDDPYRRYYFRKITRYLIVAASVVVLAIVWHAFAGRLAVVFGLTAAGLAFAMQEVIGALAGWFNIVSGGIFRVGDRIEMGGVRGDVIDVTPLRTKVMEIGSPEDDTWVSGRQYTGRLVALSNKKTFTEPVFNYSTLFEYIWEELTVPVPYDVDWQQAERIVLGVVADHSSSTEAVRAMAGATRRYPIAAADMEPRVFVRLASNGAELTARFVVPVRTARSTKDEIAREILSRFEADGIRVASESSEVTIRPPGPEGDPGRGPSSRHD